jgi:hypothetical protein
MGGYLVDGEEFTGALIGIVIEDGLIRVSISR